MRPLLACVIASLYLVLALTSTTGYLTTKSLTASVTITASSSTHVPIFNGSFVLVGLQILAIIGLLHVYRRRLSDRQKQ